MEVDSEAVWPVLNLVGWDALDDEIVQRLEVLRH